MWELGRARLPELNHVDKGAGVLFYVFERAEFLIKDDDARRAPSSWRKTLREKRNKNNFFNFTSTTLLTLPIGKQFFKTTDKYVL